MLAPRLGRRRSDKLISGTLTSVAAQRWSSVCVDGEDWWENIDEDLEESEKVQPGPDHPSITRPSSINIHPYILLSTINYLLMIIILSSIHHSSTCLPLSGSSIHSFKHPSIQLPTVSSSIHLSVIQFQFFIHLPVYSVTIHSSILYLLTSFIRLL